MDGAARSSLPDVECSGVVGSFSLYVPPLVSCYSLCVSFSRRVRIPFALAPCPSRECVRNVFCQPLPLLMAFSHSVWVVMGGVRVEIEDPLREVRSRVFGPESLWHRATEVLCDLKCHSCLKCSPSSAVERLPFPLFPPFRFPSSRPGRALEPRVLPLFGFLWFSLFSFPFSSPSLRHPCSPRWLSAFSVFTSLSLKARLSRSCLASVVELVAPFFPPPYYCHGWCFPTRLGFIPPPLMLRVLSFPVLGRGSSVLFR